jgi:hypothetical protein
MADLAEALHQQDAYERDLASVRAALGEAALAAARALGRSMTPEQAMAGER